MLYIKITSQKFEYNIKDHNVKHGLCGLICNPLLENMR